MKFEKVQGERVIAYVKCPYCGVIEKVYYYYGDFECYLCPTTGKTFQKSDIR